MVKGEVAGVLIASLRFFQTLMNVQFLTVPVLTLATTLLVRSLVPVQVVSSWVLGNGVVKVKLLTISNKLHQRI